MLDTLHTLSPPRRVHFWRDKQQREVDFVVPRSRGACDAIECKWRGAAFDPKGLAAFRAVHPRGANYVVTADTREAYTRQIGDLSVAFTNLTSLPNLLA